MPEPIKRRELIRRLRLPGWVGPESGGSHMAMVRGTGKIVIPNPPGSGDGDWTLVKRMLRQAEIDPGAWERLGR